MLIWTHNKWKTNMYSHNIRRLEKYYIFLIMKNSMCNRVGIKQEPEHDMLDQASCGKISGYRHWAPSQYKDRLIYVWRFPY